MVWKEGYSEGLFGIMCAGAVSALHTFLLLNINQGKRGMVLIQNKGVSLDGTIFDKLSIVEVCGEKLLIKDGERKC